MLAGIGFQNTKWDARFGGNSEAHGRRNLRGSIGKSRFRMSGGFMGADSATSKKAEPIPSDNPTSAFGSENRPDSYAFGDTNVAAPIRKRRCMICCSRTGTPFWQ
jgi:hypothetical protein